MIDGLRVLAVIPARGGSKGIPLKNIRELAGIPLLAHTIVQTRGVPEIDTVVVSTDDARIAAVAAEWGARVIDRPAELATSEARTETALLHSLDMLEAAGEPPYDLIAVLEPTSPLRRPATIGRCLAALARSTAPSLMTVTETTANIGRLEDGRFRPLDPNAPRRRQERQPLYVESSTVYVCRVDYLRRTGSLVSPDWLAEVVSADEAVDINEPRDLLIAEAFMKSGDAKP